MVRRVMLAPDENEKAKEKESKSKSILKGIIHVSCPHVMASIYPFHLGYYHVSKGSNQLASHEEYHGTCQKSSRKYEDKSLLRSSL